MPLYRNDDYWIANYKCLAKAAAAAAAAAAVVSIENWKKLEQ